MICVKDEGNKLNIELSGALPEIMAEMTELLKVFRDALVKEREEESGMRLFDKVVAVSKMTEQEKREETAKELTKLFTNIGMESSFLKDMARKMLNKLDEGEENELS